MQVPFHRPWLTHNEEEAVLRVLRSGWLTTGAETQAFEEEFAAWQGSGEAVGTLSCTTALEILLASLQLPPGSEVITSSLTFASTAHAIVHQGLVPVFADVLPGTLLLDPASVAQKIGPRTRALLPVHVGGHACNMEALGELAADRQLYLVEDCAHALEARWQGQPLGSFGYGGAFSFYANKNMTTGEGGMAWVQDPALAARLRLWRNHGLDYDSYARDRRPEGHYQQYDILLPGYKYAMFDLQAALGRVQLRRVTHMHHRRQLLAARYQAGLAPIATLAQPLLPDPRCQSAWHLFVLRLNSEALTASRDQIVAAIRQAGVGLSIHFKPVHRFSYYQQLGWLPGDVPQAEAMHASVCSLPLFPAMTEAEQDFVIQTVTRILKQYAR